MTHPTELDLHAWVDGALEEEQSRALEQHTAMCELCALKLSRTAQADELMRTAGKARRTTHRKQWALAAGVLVFLGLSSVLHASHPRGGVVDLGEVICPDGDDQAQCVADAVAHGRVVAYPLVAEASVSGDLP
jgi:hypothetical protein